MKKNIFHFIGAEAISKGYQDDQKVIYTQNLYEIEDILSLLQSASEKISDALPSAELHFVTNKQTLVMFERTKQKCYDEILKLIDKAYTEETQKVSQKQRITEAVEIYNKFGVECQEKWSKKIWDIYEFSINLTKNTEKIQFSSHEILFKINNLKELAMSLSTNLEECYKINGKDPLEFLKNHPNILVLPIVQEDSVEGLADISIINKIPEGLEEPKIESTISLEDSIIISENVQPTKIEEPPININPEVKQPKQNPSANIVGKSCLEGCTII